MKKIREEKFINAAGNECIADEYVDENGLHYYGFSEIVMLGPAPQWMNDYFDQPGWDANGSPTHEWPPGPVLYPTDLKR